MIDSHTLYVDNFRGFRNTYVPILDVNFFVGENSTGKTSILNLLKLAAGERLLVANEFSDDDVSLGTFKDIVSLHADDRRYFRIGMIRRDNPPNKTPMPMGVLVKYEEHEGLPRDTHFTCSFGTKELAVRRVGKEFHYRVRENAITPTTNMKQMFPRWIRDQDAPGGDFKRLDFDLEPQNSLLFPISVIAQNVKRSAGHFSILTPMIFQDLAWVAPIRTKPRRTYDELRRSFSSEGSHTPFLIRKILDSRPDAKRFLDIISKVGKDSSLFESINVKPLGDSEDVTAPFEVQIVLDQKPFNVMNVGYGVSQSLPVMVEILWRRFGTWFAIQQPEVHLHPKAQAALGSLVFTMALTEKKNFVIETHSDFMIDRFRSHFKRTRGPKPESQVVFFERRNRQNTAASLVIGDSGELPASQPKSYRDFFLKETIRVLDL